MPKPISNAATFFRETFADGVDSYARIAALVTDNAEENEWREFKSAAWFDAPKRTADVIKRHDEDFKRLWSENLSAFANSGDGILIWGIDAPDERAKTVSLPRDATLLADRLRALVKEAVEPLVQGVDVRVALRGKTKEGFVACLIPHSAYGPHCARWAHGGYYLRGQSSNLVMRPEVLRRMFYPQTSPRLIPIVHVSAVQVNDARFSVSLRIEIKNEGLASARAAFIDVQIRSDRVLEQHLNERLWTKRYPNVPGSSVYKCVETIHPGETILLLSNVSHPGAYEELADIRTPFRCEFRIFAEHAPALVGELAISSSDFLASLPPRRSLPKRAIVTELSDI